MPPYKTERYKQNPDTQNPHRQRPRRNTHTEQTTGYRGELYSRKLRNTLGTSFFFNLKENRERDIYLNIVESKQNEAAQQNDGPARAGQDDNPAREEHTKASFQRHSILIFAEQRDAFARECLAALEALEKGQNFQSHIESSQRNFHLQTNKRGGRLHLVLREESQHYDKLLQEQIQIPQSSAPYFSKALIETIEQWLLYEKKIHAMKLETKNRQAPTTRTKKKVVALKKATEEPK